MAVQCNPKKDSVIPTNTVKVEIFVLHLFSHSMKQAWKLKHAIIYFMCLGPCRELQNCT